MNFEIKSRYSSEVLFSCELSAEVAGQSYSLQLGFAVKAAVKAHANLADANLANANLADANLAHANLANANLADANLANANLTNANLANANLAGAYLAHANLADANLANANLAGAYLAHANLADANLAGAYLAHANLAHANLAHANLANANLRSFKADLWMTLTQNAHEVPALVAALREGRVDGSTYEGPCACLVGTIANARGVSHDDMDHIANNPAERWFLMIHRGDTPDKETSGGFAAKMALEWVMDWCAVNGVDIPAPVEVV